MAADSRHRAPFAHTSSSADLTSPELLSPLRQIPTQSRSQWGQTSPTEGPDADGYFGNRRDAGPSQPMNMVAGLWGGTPSMVKKNSDDNLFQTGVYERLNGAPPTRPHHPPHHPSHHLSYATLSLDSPSPYYRSFSPLPSRSSTPHPFAIPSFTFPALGTIRFVSLCGLWYTCSAVSSNTGKVILNNFRYPVTLTIVQFFFVAGYCVICSRPELGWTSKLRSPTKSILRGTLPMAAFQVGGHIFSSLAISRVPVSTVHTIKALSPLVTVLAYAVLFSVSYSYATYLSLLPLTLGVMLACSFDMSLSNIFGLICAFGSTIVFVSQNIFFKKIMPTNAEPTTTGKLDKINLLYFSSGTAFLLMIPLWLYSDARRIVEDWSRPAGSHHDGPSVPLYFFLNGTVHFAQNLLAFAILSSTSPVTYSIASLVKRIAVICLAIVWFKQAVHPVQAMGIALTAVGLWMYNNAKRDVEKGEKKARQVVAVRDGLLPTTKAEQRVLEGKASIEPNGPVVKDVHSSPRPIYNPTPVSLPISKSSAVRTAGFQLANTSPSPSTKPVQPSHMSEAPYPSPPASVTSSPPRPAPLVAPPAVARVRRLSNEPRDDDFRLPPLSSVHQQPTIGEETPHAVPAVLPQISTS